MITDFSVIATNRLRRGALVGHCDSGQCWQGSCVQRGG